MFPFRLSADQTDHHNFDICPRLCVLYLPATSVCGKKKKKKKEETKQQQQKQQEVSLFYVIRSTAFHIPSQIQ
jgi:hypothetical protein